MIGCGCKIKVSSLEIAKNIVKLQFSLLFSGLDSSEAASNSHISNVTMFSGWDWCVVESFEI